MKQTVFYNPYDDQHRELFLTFIKTGKWSHSPVLFKVHSFGNAVARMQQMTLEYYAEQELEHLSVA